MATARPRSVTWRSRRPRRGEDRRLRHLTSRGRTTTSSASSRASRPSRCPRDGARSGSLLRLEEPFARVRQPAQERGRLPDVAVPALGLQHAGLDRLEPHLFCPEHRAAPVDRPAVAVDPDHVDVARADRELLLEDLRSLVHHRVEQALEDLLVRDRAALDRLLPGDLEDDLLDVGIGDRRAVAALVAVIAGAGLLAEAPELAEAVGDQGALAPPLADPPAHVEAGEIAHRERPHRESEIVEHLVHLLRERALEDEPLRLLAALVEHAVADEAIADADQQDRKSTRLNSSH